MSNQTLYTFVMDWNGGTYVSQFSGNDVSSTITTWADSIDTNMLDIQPEDKANFVADAKSENAVALDGVSKTWAISPNIKGKMATVNIVETTQ